MQRQGDEWRVFGVNVAAQAACFHPGANRDAAFFEEVDTGQELVEAFQQFVFAQFSGLGDAFFMLEQFDQEEAWRVKGAGGIGQKASTQRRVPTQEQGEEDVGVNDELGLNHSAFLRSEALLVRLPPVCLDFLGQLPRGLRVELAPAGDGFHAEPGDQVVDLVRG